jgi:hypothetical protein
MPATKQFDYKKGKLFEVKLRGSGHRIVGFAILLRIYSGLGILFAWFLFANIRASTSTHD